MRICYSQTHSVESLIGVGIRIRGVEELSDIISASLIELHLVINPGPQDIASNDHIPMAFPCRVNVLAPRPLPKKTAKRAAWEDSVDRFQAGTTLEIIALTHSKGIQVTTVVGHVMDGFRYGR